MKATLLRSFGLRGADNKLMDGWTSTAGMRVCSSKGGGIEQSIAKAGLVEFNNHFGDGLVLLNLLLVVLYSR